MASTATRVEIASSHISVSLLNIPPSMPKLLGRTSDNRQPMLRIRVARYANADASECGKEKASSPHKPHAEQEAF